MTYQIQEIKSYHTNLMNEIFQLGGIESNPFIYCHSNEDRQIPLYGRYDILKRITEIWKLRQKSFSNNSTNRTDYKHPVCVGISGVGKTRLLEEWLSMFDMMGISSTNRTGLLVLYFNGHGLCSVDNVCAIEKTFAWRILQRHFFDGSEFRQHMNLLENSNIYDGLTISEAILAVLSSKRDTFDESNPISFFLGIDEFQSITGLEEDGIDKLDRLMTLLFEATLYLNKNHNVHLYTMFAGTEWERISSTSSSRDLCTKINIPFQRNYAGIASNIYPETIRSEVFQQCLFTLGNIPRSVVNFSRRIQNECHLRDKFPTANRIKQIRNDISNEHSNQWRLLLDGNSLLTLVAYCVSRTSVSPADSPGISLVSHSVRSPEVSKPTWQQMADRGLVEFTSCGDSEYVTIPYVGILQCLACDHRDDISQSLCRIRFMDSLRIIHELASISDVPWYKWELFGAHFHCLRINALLVLGRETISINDLFPGARTNLSTIRPVVVQLRPAEVFFADNELAEESNLNSIPESENLLRTVNLFESSMCHIVVNGSGGKGVDLYFVLHTVCGRTVLFLDQRKREAKPLTTGALSKYIKLMPKPSVNGMLVVFCIFSALATYGKRKVRLPNDRCVIMSRKELKHFHSCLSFHPCACSVVDPHSSRLSILTSVLREYMSQSAAGRCAKQIRELCKSQIFFSFESLRNALSDAYGVQLSDDLKYEFFFTGDERNGNDHDGDGDDEDSDNSDEDMPFSFGETLKISSEV